MIMTDIRVNRGIVVNVNDNGDTITIPVEDQQFIDRFYRLIDKLDKISAEMNSDAVKALETRSQVQKLMELTKDLMEDIDEMFGEGCCRKVFGDMIPSPYLLADFFEQLTPVAEQYMDERQKFIAKKYNRNRKGGSHV